MPIPNVSVIIPTLNSEKFVGDAVKSVFSQTYKNWEIVIVDSGSKDRTKNIVRNFRSKKIKIFFCHKSRGLSYSRYIGILKSKGNYIAFLDSDDLWSKDKLNVQMKLPDYKKKFCSTSFLIFNNKNNNFFYDDSKSGSISKSNLIVNRPIALSSTLVHRKTLLLNIKRRLKNKYAEDYVWWVHLTNKGYKFFKLKSYLTKLRLHEQNRSLNFLKNWISLIAIYKNEYSYSNLKIIIIFFFLIIKTFKKNLFKFGIKIK